MPPDRDHAVDGSSNVSSSSTTTSTGPPPPCGVSCWVWSPESGVASGVASATDTTCRNPTYSCSTSSTATVTSTRSDADPAFSDTDRKFPYVMDAASGSSCTFTSFGTKLVVDVTCDPPSSLSSTNFNAVPGVPAAS